MKEKSGSLKLAAKWILVIFVCGFFIFDTQAQSVDADGDGFDSTVDCDDSNPCVNFNAMEFCDNLDNDCNGAVDDNNSSDTDADGFTECTGDCNDFDALINPNATEIPNNGIDEDCNCLDLTTNSIQESSTYQKFVIGYYNLMGIPCDYQSNCLLLFKFSDGTYKRVMHIEN